MRFSSLALLFVLTGCLFGPPPDHFEAKQISFAALAGWAQDDHLAALNVFKKSCPVLAAKPRPATGLSAISIDADTWQSLCDEANKVITPAQARGFFERRFVPFRIANNGKEQGLFTGYYEPVLYGSLRKHGDFKYPLYAKPDDVKDGEPYYTHAQINGGALSGRKLELLWVDDPVMLFFMQIQGSGRVRLTDGRELRIGYAGKNGQPYVSLGKVIGDEGLLPKDQIDFFTIRQWLYNHPDKAFELIERNPSYVFFQIINQPEGPMGALNVALTPERSLAIDHRHIPYGLPLYLETDLPAQASSIPFDRLMVAQDTGGAIRGPVRGDIFFGVGDEAEYLAGYMKGRGVYSLLVPKEIAGQLQ